jgi:hypothetical protein
MFDLPGEGLLQKAEAWKKEIQIRFSPRVKQQSEYSNQ